MEKSKNANKKRQNVIKTKQSNYKEKTKAENQMYSLQKFSQDLATLNYRFKVESIRNRQQTLKKQKIQGYIQKISQFLAQKQNNDYKTCPQISDFKNLPELVGYDVPAIQFPCSLQNRFLPHIKINSQIRSLRQTNKQFNIKLKEIDKKQKFRSLVRNTQNREYEINQNNVKLSKEKMKNFKKSNYLNKKIMIDSLQQLQQTIRYKQKRAGVKKLKIYAIAVYFCIIFPKMVLRFCRARLKWFHNRYTSIKYLKDHNDAILQSLLRINIESIYIKSKTYQPEFQKTQYPLINFIRLYLNQIRTTLTQIWNLRYHFQLFGAGVLNKHFLINFIDDYMYLPQQLQILQIRRSKILHSFSSQYRNNQIYQIKVDKKQQAVLILIRVLFKVIIYTYLFKVLQRPNIQLSRSTIQNYIGKNSSGFNRKQKKKERQEQNIQQMIKVFTIYIHKIGTEIYQICLNNTRRQASSLIQNNDSQLKGVKLKLLNRYSIKNKINYMNELKKQQKQFEYNPNSSFTYIQAIQDYEQINNQIQKSSILMEFKQQFADTILDMVVEIYLFLIQEQKKTYRDVWFQVLNQSKIGQNDIQIKQIQRDIKENLVQRNKNRCLDRQNIVYQSQQKLVSDMKNINKNSKHRRMKTSQDYPTKSPQFLSSYATLQTKYQKTLKNIKFY